MIALVVNFLFFNLDLNCLLVLVFHVSKKFAKISIQFEVKLFKLTRGVGAVESKTKSLCCSKQLRLPLQTAC